MTNSAHDTGVVSEGEREIARRNWWCNFRPATARIKPSERHIGRPKPAICEASVSAATMTDISESSDRRTQSQPIASSTGRLPKRVCVRRCVQHRPHNMLNCAAGTLTRVNLPTFLLAGSFLHYLTTTSQTDSRVRKPKRGNGNTFPRNAFLFP